MKFVQVTDLHLVPHGGPLFDTDPVERLRLCLADITVHHGDAEFVVFTGDLAHHGEVGAYEILRRELESFPIPVYFTLGNHDDRRNFRTVFPEAATDPHGFLQVALDTPRARVILADTKDDRAGIHSGVLCRRRLDWIAEAIDNAGGRPVLIGMHHPPMLIGFDAGVDVISLIEPERIWAILETRPQVRHLFFGHVHRPVAGSWRGVSFSMSYGTNHQAALNIWGARNKGRRGPAEYVVFLVDQEGNVAAHFHDYLYAYPEIAQDGMDGGPIPLSERALSSEELDALSPS